MIIIWKINEKNKKGFLLPTWNYFFAPLKEIFLRGECDMAKLTRRKRNELKYNPNKQKKKELCKCQ